MAKMTKEELDRYYAKPHKPENHLPGDIESLQGEALLNEIEARAMPVLARCAAELDKIYPCFEKTIEVRLKDVADRVSEQIIGCDVAAYLTAPVKPTEGQSH